MSINKCVVSFANERGNYLKGIDRLHQSVDKYFDGVFLGFIGEDSIGAPSHYDNPYAFKIYAIEQALEAGFTQILWLDSSVFAIKNMRPIFDVIDKQGYIMQEAGHFAGTWTNDTALQYFGITRSQANYLPMYGNAGFLGLNFEHDTAQKFFSKWKSSMLAGCFVGDWTDHRHDMSCGSIIANQLGMIYERGDEWLEYAKPGTKPKNETIILQASGL